MKISYSLEVEFSIQKVWDLVQYPRRSMGAMPGVESVDVRDATTFDITVAQRMGAIRFSFQVTMSIESLNTPPRFVDNGQGKDSSG